MYIHLNTCSSKSYTFKGYNLKTLYCYFKVQSVWTKDLLPCLRHQWGLVKPSAMCLRYVGRLSSITCHLWFFSEESIREGERLCKQRADRLLVQRHGGRDDVSAARDGGLWWADAGEVAEVIGRQHRQLPTNMRVVSTLFHFYLVL